MGQLVPPVVIGAGVKRRPITDLERQQWGQTFRKLMSVALSKTLGEAGVEFAMHGGLALTLYYGLPRQTMDMDFLIDGKSLGGLTSDIAKSMAAVQVWYKRYGIDVSLSLSSKEGGEKSIWRYKITSSNDAIMGSVKVNMEFWPVPVDYIRKRVLSGEAGMVTGLGFTVPERSGTVISSGGILSDKFLSILMRPYMKWGDAFDLSYLLLKSGEVDINSVFDGLKSHAEVYEKLDFEIMKRRVSMILDHPDEDIMFLVEDASGLVGVSDTDAVEAIAFAPEALRSYLPMALSVFDPDARARIFASYSP